MASSWQMPAYNAAAVAAFPFVAGGMAIRARGRRQWGRFTAKAPQSAAHGFWLQACSVGEVRGAEVLLAGLQRRWPDIPRLLTASTDTGMGQALQSRAATATAWCPLDFPWIVRPFVRQLRPYMLLLFETELWPNMLSAVKRSCAPVVIVNGRISDRSWPSYRRARAFLRPILASVDCACVQAGVHAERLSELGVAAARIQVTGNVKVDQAMAPPAEGPERGAFAKALGLDGGRPVIVFGSTGPGEEALAAECWRKVGALFPEAQLVVAPRHPERGNEASACFEEPTRRRSACNGSGAERVSRVLVLDTLGELTSVYALADVAVVGGSFLPGTGGHNPLEPAGLGIPTIFGPHMENFAEAARLLAGNNAALQCPRERLACELAAVLQDEARRKKMGSYARRAVAANGGATERTLDALASLVNEHHG